MCILYGIWYRKRALVKVRTHEQIRGVLSISKVMLSQGEARRIALNIYVLGRDIYTYIHRYIQTLIYMRVSAPLRTYLGLVGRSLPSMSHRVHETIFSVQLHKLSLYNMQHSHVYICTFFIHIYICIIDEAFISFLFHKPDEE